MTQTLSPRAARTRKALLTAGLGLLARRPIDAISIDELVAAAGVAKGSFFNHFADKEQFAISVVREVRMELEQWVAQINHRIEEPLRRLAGGMIASAAFAMQRPEPTRVLAGAFRGLSLNDHPLNAGLLHDLRDAVALRQIRLPSEQVGVLFWLENCQVLMSSILEHQAGEMRPADLLTALLRMGLRGLGATEDAISELTQQREVEERLARAAPLGSDGIV